MEYIKGGCLLTEIKRKGSFTEREAALIVRQLLATLCYCKSKNIVHRDIKPENIMLGAAPNYE
jgi:serine/threonine protein kinase